MSNLIPLNDNLPSTIVGRAKIIDVNKDIVTVQAFPSLSIKGKVFTLVKDNERRVLTKPDDPDEVLQSVNLAFLRINMNSKTFYKKRFSEEDSEGARPDCSSMDGITPDANIAEPQAKKCAACPHNAWGSRISDDGQSKGKACADHARIAVADPRHLDKPMLLRVPPASLRPLKDDALKAVKNRNLQYNEAVYRVGFDREAASPKLTFRPVALLDDASYEQACDLFESETVRAIVGADPDAAHQEAPAPEVEPDELDAALQARDATRKAAAKPAPAPAPAVDADELAAVVDPKPAKPKAEAKPAKPKAEPVKAPAKVEASDSDDLLGDLDSILGGSDD